MSDAERIAAFIALADEELIAARLLARTAPRQTAYFVQQAAEKAARTLLTAANIPFGTSHGLGQMAMALPQAHPLRSAVMALDKYSVAATKYRYPSPGGRLTEPPGPDAISASIGEVELFIAEVRRHLLT